MERFLRKIAEAEINRWTSAREKVSFYFLTSKVDKDSIKKVNYLLHDRIERDKDKL